MGNIQAFKAVVKTQTEPDKVDLKNDNNESYYKKILEDALITFEPSINPSPLRTSESDTFENLLKENWGDFKILGYIKQDNHHAKNRNSILRKVAEEEEKYFYRLSDNNQNILADLELIRLNIVVYDKIFFKPSNINYQINNESLKSLYNSLNLQIKGIDNSWNRQKAAASFFIPLIISFADFKKDNDNYYGVYLNQLAKPSYLNIRQETEFFQYKEDSQGYKYVKTWKFDQTKIKPINDGGFNKKNDDIYADYYFSDVSDVNDDDNYDDYNLNWQKKVRYYYYLRESLPSNIKSLIRGSVFNELTRKNILKEVDKLSSKTKIKSEAKDKAHKIPNKHQCFYYQDKGILCSFVSSVSIAEGSGGLSGYAMRADKLSEVDYQWFITADTDSEEDKHLAKLLSYVIGLERQKLLNEELEVSNDFFPTNWPSDKMSNFKSQLKGMKSLIHYYKKFDNVPRRNNPPHPQIPRIAHSDRNDYPSKKYEKKNDFKLDNTSYRIWKKGENFTGEKLTIGSSETRLDAGSVMAEALNQFQFYSDIVDKSDKKATYAKLPATAFAKYVVTRDSDAKKQWAEDTGVAENKIDQASVNTDQEWCHLFGHGDGGSEELGNFVSGSKHCNTEQLAIETGQRRISQNENLKGQVELRAKITAYLMPNKGAWISQEKTEVEQCLFDKEPKDKWKKLLFRTESRADITDNKDQELWDILFVKDDNYKEEHLKRLFQKLSDAIGQESKDEQGLQKRAELFQVRRKLQSKFFLYLPLGRWMRYKIYYKNQKIFDHIYDAQSQSFDYNECQILDYTVERAIYNALDKQKFMITNPDDQNQKLEAYKFYKGKIKERVKDLVSSETEADIINTILEVDKVLNQMLRNWDLPLNRYIDSIVASAQDYRDGRQPYKTLQQENERLGELIKTYDDAISDSEKRCTEVENKSDNLQSPQNNIKLLKVVISDLKQDIQKCKNIAELLKSEFEKIKEEIKNQDLMDTSELKIKSENAKKRKRDEMTKAFSGYQKGGQRRKFTEKPQLEQQKSITQHFNDLT